MVEGYEDGGEWLLVAGGEVGGEFFEEEEFVSDLCYLLVYWQDRLDLGVSALLCSS